MNALRQTALSSARRTRLPITRQPRRYAHDAHDAGHHASTPESFSNFFWILLAGIPTSYLVYSASRPSANGERPYLTRVMDIYSDWQEVNATRNAIHTKAMEEAAETRHLFYGSKPSKGKDLKFPEIMNVGSPFNVPAGHYTNIERVIAKYEKENLEENQRKLELLKEGKSK